MEKNLKFVSSFFFKKKSGISSSAQDLPGGAEVCGEWTLRSSGNSTNITSASRQKKIVILQKPPKQTKQRKKKKKKKLVKSHIFKHDNWLVRKE